MRGPTINPTETQQTAVAGLDGVEEKRLGERGAYTFVEGRAYGPTPGDLNLGLGTLRGATRWGYCVLTDQFNNAWPKVRMDSFEQEGRISYDPGGLGYTQLYKCRFFHPYLPY